MTPSPLIDFADGATPTSDWEGPDAPRRRWLIRHRDGSVASHSFSPPASRAEVTSWYPGAECEPEQQGPP